MFQTELAKVSEIIGAVISGDNYPDSIAPGYLRDTVRDYPARNGKRLRPALLIWSCGLFGGKPESAELAAAAVEIYHNWTLVHDDIIDNDGFRRGKPTSHVKIAEFAKKDFSLGNKNAVKFGRDMAMLAGDIQQGWALNMLLKSVEKKLIPSGLCITLARRMQELVNRELISGEALDVEFSNRPQDPPSVFNLEKMYYLKTGALLRFCAEAGAIIALGDSHGTKTQEVNKIGDFASLCGVAFQLKDDWLGIYGDENILGKPTGSDFSEMKPTAIYLKALELSTQKEKNTLSAFFGKKVIGKRGMLKIRETITGCGAEKEILSKSESLKREAMDILLGFGTNKYRDLLADWAEFILGRDK